jgi:GT2 family glycosyltransferase
MNPIAIVIPTLDAARGASTGKLAQVTAGCDARLIVVNGPKRGFTATVNDGLAQTANEDVCILNDDIRWFTPGWLATLQRALYSARDIALVGPTGKSSTKPMATGKLGDSGLEDVHHIPFWCVLVKRATLKKLGGLDSRFIHYASDNLYCDRAHAAGLRCVWVKDVYLRHDHHGSGLISTWAKQDLELYRQVCK